MVASPSGGSLFVFFGELRVLRGGWRHGYFQGEIGIREPLIRVNRGMTMVRYNEWFVVTGWVGSPWCLRNNRESDEFEFRWNKYKTEE